MVCRRRGGRDGRKMRPGGLIYEDRGRKCGAARIKRFEVLKKEVNEAFSDTPRSGSGRAVAVCKLPTTKTKQLLRTT